MKILRLLAVVSAAFFIASAQAQNAGTVTNHAFALGKGAGTTGYTSLLCGSAQLAVGQTAADPICRTITGDVTLTAAGATAIGATKVTSAMLNADVFSTAHTWAGQQTFVAPIIGTPASGTLTNATGLPIGTGVSGLGTGIATFLGTPSSANLRASLTDEVGTGAAYFVGGALGTPASGTATNLTGLPVGTGISGLGTGIATSLAVNVGTAGAPVVNGGVLGTPSSGVATNLTGTASGLTAGTVTTNANLTGDVSSVGNATVIGTAKVTYAMMQNVAALSVVGRSANSSGVPGAISCVAASDAVLRESGSVLGCGTIATAGIANNAVTNAKLATMNAYTIKANATGSGAIPTDVSIPALTQKASPVAADKIMIADSAASDALKYATVSSLASAGSVASLNGQTGALVAFFPPQGRLTLATGTPVMTGNNSAKTTIFYTPYVGNMVPIYDGTNMVPTAVAEISVLTTDTTKSPAAIGASKVNDWFIWNDSGTIRIGHGPDWTNDTTRSAGTALVMVNGIYLNNASITNGPAASRGTYVGTTRSNASSQLDWIYGGLATGGTAAFFGVWNMYNRKEIRTFVADSTDTWSYTTANTFRAPNASATMRIQAVRGMDEDHCLFEYNAIVLPGASVTALAAVGLNSTSSVSGTTGVTAAAVTATISGKYSGTFGLGFNFASALEGQNSATATTWIGDAASFGVQSGLHGSLWQ